MDAPGAAAPLPLVPCLLPGHRLPGASQSTRSSSPSVAGTPPTRAGPGSDLRPRCAAPPPPLPLQMPKGGALLLAALLLAGTLSATPGLGSPVSAGRGQTPPESCPLSAKGGDRIRTGLGGGWALRARNGSKRRAEGRGGPGPASPAEGGCIHEDAPSVGFSWRRAPAAPRQPRCQPVGLNPAVPHVSASGKSEANLGS